MSTAMLVAACRAKFYEKHGKGDVFASKIVGDQISAFDPVIAKFPPGSVDIFTYRMLWTDEKMYAPFNQVVLLGAGMDTLRTRIGPDRKLFEVDLPATQEIKKARVKDVYDDSNVTYVPCDFETQDFMAQLVAHGLDLNLPTVYIWMGVTYYLNRDTVEKTLSNMTSTHRASCQILFDYAVDIRPDESVAQAEGELKKMKEPIQTKFADIAPVILATKGDRTLYHLEDESILSYITNAGGEVFPDDKRLLRLVSVIYAPLP